MFDVELKIKFRIKCKDYSEFIKETYKRKVPVSFDGYNFNAYVFNPQIEVTVNQNLIPVVKLEMRQALDMGGCDE